MTFLCQDQVIQVQVSAAHTQCDIIKMCAANLLYNDQILKTFLLLTITKYLFLESYCT